MVKPLPWKCKNPKCKKIFYVWGRISTEKKPQYPPYSEEGATTRIIIDQPCCPHCQSIDFEPAGDGE